MNFFSASFFKRKNQHFTRFLSALAVLPLSVSAQVAHRLDMSFGVSGIATYSIPNNYYLHNTGCVLNNDGTVWFAGRLSDTTDNTVTQYVGRYLSNGSSDANFGTNGLYGHTYPATSSFIGSIFDLHKSKNGGVFAPFSGYGGYCVLSPTAATSIAQIQNFELNDVVFSEKINDSVVVVLDNANRIYTYKSNDPNTGYTNQSNWFNNGTAAWGQLPMSVNNIQVSYYQKVVAQSNGKLLVAGATANETFILRLKLNSATEIDSTFGTNGVRIFPNVTYPGTNVDAIMVNPFDDILLSLGTTHRITKVMADGTIDPTLGVSSYSGVPPIKIFTDGFENIYIATEFALYAFQRNGVPVNSFHNGKNTYNHDDADIHLGGWSIRDFDRNDNGDFIVSGVLIQTQGALHEAFVLKLKKENCGLEIYANNITENSIQFEFITSQYPVYIQLCDLGPLAGGEGGTTCIYDTLTNLDGSIYYATGLLPNHNYSFSYTNPSGCSISTEAATLATSIENTLNGLQMYPNPAAQSLFIKSEEGLSHVTIYNTMMQAVWDADIVSNEINISALPVGLYHAHITAPSGKQAVRSFVKE